MQYNDNLARLSQGYAITLLDFESIFSLLNTITRMHRGKRCMSNFFSRSRSKASVSTMTEKKLM